ncbi:MAG: hypothetical protein Q9207_002686 [Kuettlingeria erythrocarpa]
MATTETWKNANGLATKVRQRSDGSLVWENGHCPKAESKACLTPTDIDAPIPANLQLGYKVVFNDKFHSKFKLQFDKDPKPPRWEKVYKPSWGEQFRAIKVFRATLSKSIVQIHPPQHKTLKAEYRHYEESIARWENEMWTLVYKSRAWDLELYHLWYKMIVEGQGIPGCPAPPRTMATAAAWAATARLTTWRSDEE